MNSIESLPKSLEYKGRTYFLNMHITAWGKYCLSYAGLEKDELGVRKLILSAVVEGERPGEPENQIPEGVEAIADAVSLDDAVRIVNTRINKAFVSILRYKES